jgi:predicted cation transporter
MSKQVKFRVIAIALLAFTAGIALTKVGQPLKTISHGEVWSAIDAAWVFLVLTMYLAVGFIAGVEMERE